MKKISQKLNKLKISYSKKAHELSMQDFVNLLEKSKVKKGYVTYFDGKMQCSHPIFEELGEFIVNDKRDFLDHEVNLKN
jgi:hypothetical protein